MKDLTSQDKRQNKPKSCLLGKFLWNVQTHGRASLAKRFSLTETCACYTCARLSPRQ